MGVISDKSDDLWAEWEASKPFHADMVDGLDGQLDRYRGEQSTKLGGKKAAALLPHEFEWISKMMARLAYDAPRFIGGTQSLDQRAEMTAQAVAHAVNALLVQTNFRNEAILACLDFNLVPAVFRTEMQEYAAQGKVKGVGPGGKGYGTPWRPVSVRESPLRTRWDPRALNIEATEWTAWATIHDRKGLIAHAIANPNEGWDLGALRAASAGAGVDEIRGMSARTEPPRDEIALIHFHIKNLDISDLLKGVKEEDRQTFHGALCTIAISGEGSGKYTAHRVRKPRPFFGPYCGPLTIIAAYPFFDLPGGMGATRPVRGIVEAVNRQIDAENTRAEKYRSGTFVDGSERVLEKVKKMIDGGVIAIPGADRAKIVPFEIHGATEQGQAQINILLARLAQASATAPAASGTVTGQGTATENAIAADSLDERTAFQRMQWNDGLRRLGRTISYYAFHSNRFVIDLPPEAAAQLGAQGGARLLGMNPDGSPRIVREEPKARYFGGRHDDSYRPSDWELLQINLEPDSTGWNSPEGQLRKMAMLNEEIGAFAGLVSNPLFAHVEWEKRGKVLTQITGDPIFSQIYNLVTAAQIAQNQALAQQAEQQAATRNAPKLGSEAGMRPQSPQTGGGGGGWRRPAQGAKPGGGGAQAPARGGVKPMAKPRASSGAAKD